VKPGMSALVESASLGTRPEVIVCRPVMRQQIRIHKTLAPLPNDPLFGRLWPLENRHPDGSRRGHDLNARAAWSTARGEGVVIAVVDDGVDLTHPEFEDAASGPYHFDFTDGTTNGMHTRFDDYHGTLVAGFAVARGGNARGIAGVAPHASLASWKIFNGSSIPDPPDPESFDDELMDMFQYLTNIVAVQNHSWGKDPQVMAPLRPSNLELRGISNAITMGRQGRGVVMVRSAGNGRQNAQDANDDGYANDPRVIAVGAVDSAGRTADYSSPGACLLVSAFGGGTDRALTSTDRTGSAGQSIGWSEGDGGDYWTSTDLSGTSFSAPQVSGIVALLLATNPALTYRDVQHILILAARQLDPSDPDLFINTAGFIHSHNTGFGVPDAARAVALARDWINRPTLIERRRVTSGTRVIPDDGLRVLVSSGEGSPTVFSAPSTPTLGPLPEGAGEALPLVDVGLATNDVSLNLHGKIALIQRGPPGNFSDDRNTFRRKIERAAAAGAVWALVHNDRDADTRFIMGETDFVPIPAVMISQTDGLDILGLLAADPDRNVRIEFHGAKAGFAINESLACEQVGLRIDMSHTRRGDLLIVLDSPTGTRSILQRPNFDTSAYPNNWTFWTTRHFGEPAAGTWTAQVIDTSPNSTGVVTRMELIVRGVALVDTDADGLDDQWELAHFDNLDPGPRDDPDGDLWPNAHEQWMGTNPVEAPDLIVWTGQLNDGRGLIAWDAVPGSTYDLNSAANAVGPFQPLGTVTADRREMEFVLPFTPETGFFRLVRR